MKAVTVNDSSVTLAEVEGPQLAAGDAVIEVRAAGLNAADLLQARGFYPAPAGWPADILGLECAGLVAEVAPDVDSAIVGRRVACIVGGGGQAQFVRVPASHLLYLPDNVDWETAGGLAETFTTAYDALFRQAELCAGDHVVISGAAGGVGTAAIQLARRAGAVVTAVTRDDRHHDELIALGAHHVTTTAAYGLVAPADVVLELVGAAHLELAIPRLAPRARVVVIGVGGGGAQLPLNLLTLMSTRATLTGSTLRARAVAEKADIAAEMQRDVMSGFAAGELRVPRAGQFALSDAPAAYEFFATAGKFGKIVLTLS